MFTARIFTGPWSIGQVRGITGAPGNVDVVVLQTFKRNGMEDFTYLVFDGGHHPAVYSTIEEMEADNYGQERAVGPEFLRKAVIQELNNGLEGGYKELLEWTPEHVAEDLLNYSGAEGVEGCSKEELIPHIQAWQEEQAIAKAERG
jgi:hypothetical protein